MTSRSRLTRTPVSDSRGGFGPLEINQATEPRIAMVVQSVRRAPDLKPSPQTRQEVSPCKGRSAAPPAWSGRFLLEARARFGLATSARRTSNGSLHLTGDIRTSRRRPSNGRRSRWGDHILGVVVPAGLNSHSATEQKNEVKLVVQAVQEVVRELAASERKFPRVLIVAEAQALPTSLLSYAMTEESKSREARIVDFLEEGLSP